jgi:hypothetical protein
MDATWRPCSSSGCSAPLGVVRLTVPLEEIERRLRSDVTAGRRDDMRQAAAWMAESTGEGIEDLVVVNDGPISESSGGHLGLAWVVGALA